MQFNLHMTCVQSDTINSMDGTHVVINRNMCILFRNSKMMTNK